MDPGRGRSVAVEKSTPLGDKQSKIAISNPQGWGFSGGLVIVQVKVTYLSFIYELPEE
jgi:hypothetical protein